MLNFICRTEFCVVSDGPVNIRVKPAQDVFEVAEFDSLVTIPCEADCNPNCTFSWTKDNLVKSSSEILYFQVIKRNDSGLYICTVVHPNGNSHTISITIRVFCKNYFLLKLRINHYMNLKQSLK